MPYLLLLTLITQTNFHLALLKESFTISQSSINSVSLLNSESSLSSAYRDQQKVLLIGNRPELIGNQEKSTTLDTVYSNSKTESKPEINTVYIRGSEGNYSTSVAVKGNIDTIWKVLTDYDNFEQYLPNVAESTLLENRGNQKVFSQVQVFSVLFFSRRSEVEISVTEDYPNTIQFKVIKGDVKSLEGSWTVRQMNAEEFLITYEVMVEPDMESQDLRTIFYNIYESSLKETIEAIQVEIAKRSQ